MIPELEETIAAMNAQGVQDAELVEASYRVAQRLFSPRGTENYLLGIKAICSLGRGPDLILSYVQEMPEIAREVGEDIIPDVIESIMKMASLTSGNVLCLMLATLPCAATRLGDAELLRGYLTLLHRLTGSVPRGLRPMLENLETLLSVLTLGGLRRWALWGAQAYARDFDGQLAYFGLQNESSKSVLQKERRGTLFIDNQRKLNFYLRALWGRSFFMRPTSGDFETRVGHKPYIDGFEIHLPDAYDAFGSIAGIDVYRAASAHAAAHIAYTELEFSSGTLSPAQICFIELFEDARIEFIACRNFPGLGKLWASFFETAIEQSGVEQNDVVNLMLCLGRAIIDPGYVDPRDLVNEVAHDFRAELNENPQSADLATRAGVNFYNRVEKDYVIPAARILNELPIPYRDDNRYFHSYTGLAFAEAEYAAYPWKRPTLRKKVSLMEMVNEIDSELEDGSPQEIWTLPTELFPYEDNGLSYNETEGVETISDPFHYPEWDYQIQVERPDWVTLTERSQGKGDAGVMEGIFDKHKPVANRIKHIIDSLQPQGVVRSRGHEDGDEIDIDAAVAAMIDIRRGIMPDTKINIRIKRHFRDLSMIVLMDLSESTNDRVGNPGDLNEENSDHPTVLDLTREATGLLSWAVDSIGDNFAIHGFASDGRHDVQYYRFKEFGEPYGEEAKRRLAGMKGGLSTRMGSAMRHAGWHLSQQASRKRLLLLITDGEPADIDERDPQYLRQDTKKAVEQLAMQGIHSYCLTLDPDADRYVSRIFGENNFSIVDNVERLPERLPMVFSAITG